jgi:hypothetical protein
MVLLAISQILSVKVDGSTVIRSCTLAVLFSMDLPLPEQAGGGLKPTLARKESYESSQTDISSPPDIH